MFSSASITVGCGLLFVDVCYEHHRECEEGEKINGNGIKMVLGLMGWDGSR